MCVIEIIKEWLDHTTIFICDSEYEYSKNRFSGIAILLEGESIISKLRISSYEVSNNKKLLQKVGDLNLLQELSLRYCKLKEVPEVIGELKTLRTLDLSANNITEIPEFIRELTSLQELSLRDSGLIEVPEIIGELKTLRSLDLGLNNLIEVPGFIGELTSLQELDLSDNKLNKIPEIMGRLKTLQSLDLSGNALKEIPECIGQFKLLQFLDLGSNQISKLPVELCQLEQLEDIRVGDNPLVEPPIEIAKQGIDAIREYFQSIENAKVSGEGTETVYEAKLMIVGEPGAGKTTLRKKLLDPNSALPKEEETTEGIDIDVWKYPYNNKDYTVNLWDFGGQEIYRSTHQFFMSERVLYVLLADSRDEKTDYYDWLHRIELFAGESPVVIVHNEIKDRKKEIDINKISGLFPRIAEPLRCNLAKINGTEREQDFNNLVDELQHKISKLKVIGQEFPKSWLDLRKELESIAEKHNYISSEKYFKICKENHGIERDGALVLGNYLHAIGAVLFFSDEDVLKHILILKPEWGTDAVYKVIDDRIVQNANGRFSRSDVSRIWSDDKYKNKYDELLKLMKRFRICYETIYEKDVYILPQLLKYPPKDYKWKEKTDLHFEYQYSGYYLKSIMYHFIVAMHQYIEDESKVYRNCVVMEKDDVKAEIKADESKESIHIKVNGSLCNDFLAIIRYEFEKIHAEYPKLQVESMVPCNCDVCKGSEEPALFKYSELCDRLKHGKDTIDCSKNKYCEVKIEPLIREFPQILINEQDKKYKKEIRNMSIDAKGDVNIIYGDGQIAKGKGIKQEITKDSEKIIDIVNNLKEAINKEDLKKEVKEKIQEVIEQIEDNDYELKPKVKVRLRDKLQNILQNVANGAAVGGVIMQLIDFLK